MRNSRTLAFAFVLFLAVPLVVGCDKSTAPESDTVNVFGSTERGAVSYGPDTLVLRSGAGACGEHDPSILVSSPCGADPQPALIGGGGAAPQCSCALAGDTLSASLPLTSLCETDSLGSFVTLFELPLTFSGVVIDMRIVADDGAAISINGRPVATVNLNDGDPAFPVVVRTLTISGDSLFVAGSNILRFDLANTGTGAYGDPAGRADTADCMYLEFEAIVRFIKLPVVTIDVKPTINCTAETGVIPVAILTTDEFDAANVDHETVRFGPNGASEAHSNPNGVIRHVEDVDLDGDLDLMFHFRRDETGIACGDTTAALWGMTIDGYDFSAVDAIRTVVGKKK